MLDRHYNSLAPYRAQQRTLYAVRGAGGLALRYVDFDDSKLVLRPLSIEFPAQVIAVRPEESPSDYIAGRVCVVVSQV